MVLPARAQGKVWKLGFLMLDANETAAMWPSRSPALGNVEGKTSSSKAAGLSDPARHARARRDLLLPGPDVLSAGWGSSLPRC